MIEEKICNQKRYAIFWYMIAIMIAYFRSPDQCHTWWTHFFLTWTPWESQNHPSVTCNRIFATDLPSLRRITHSTRLHGFYEIWLQWAKFLFQSSYSLVLRSQWHILPAHYENSPKETCAIFMTTVKADYSFLITRKWKLWKPRKLHIPIYYRKILRNGKICMF